MEEKEFAFSVVEPQLEFQLLFEVGEHRLDLGVDGPNNVHSVGPIKERNMICTIIDIRGDYAYVKYQDTGVVSEVAIALLPFGVDVGDKLKFEDYEFTQI